SAPSSTRVCQWCASSVVLADRERRPQAGQVGVSVGCFGGFVLLPGWTTIPIAVNQNVLPANEGKRLDIRLEGGEMCRHAQHRPPGRLQCHDVKSGAVTRLNELIAYLAVTPLVFAEERPAAVLPAPPSHRVDAMSGSERDPATHSTDAEDPV